MPSKKRSDVLIAFHVPPEYREKLEKICAENNHNKATTFRRLIDNELAIIEDWPDDIQGRTRLLGTQKQWEDRRATTAALFDIVHEKVDQLYTATLMTNYESKHMYNIISKLLISITEHLKITFNGDLVEKMQEISIKQFIRKHHNLQNKTINSGNIKSVIEKNVFNCRFSAPGVFRGRYFQTYSITRVIFLVDIEPRHTDLPHPRTNFLFIGT